MSTRSEYMRDYMRNYYKSNKNGYLDKKKKYYQLNKDRIKAYNKQKYIPKRKKVINQDLNYVVLEHPIVIEQLNI